jgi:hypothetical protein
VRLSVVEGERAEDLVAVAQRQRHHGARPFRGMGLTVFRVEPLRGCDVLGDQRAVERDRHRPVADRRGRVGDVLVGQARVCGNGPGLARLVILPQRVAVGRERALREREHGGQHLLDLERPQDGRRGFEQESQAIELLGVRLGIDWSFGFDVVSGHGAPRVYASLLTVTLRSREVLTRAADNDPLHRDWIGKAPPER